MRTLVRISMDVERSNEAIKSGALPKLMERAHAQLKPESAYFFSEHGKRSAQFVFDMADPSDIPAIAEPWFMETGATVEFFPVMNADDLKTGLQKAIAMREPAMAGAAP